MDEFIHTIYSSNLFSGITKEEIFSMLNCLNARLQNYDAEELISREGDPVDEIALVLKGNVLIVQEDRWGNRNIVAKVNPSETFGTATACSHGAILHFSVIAETDAEVMYLDVQKILTTCSSRCTHHIKVIHNLIKELANNNLRLTKKVTHLGKRSTREKLMSYLSSESQKYGKCEFDIPFSRQQLADYLGVERSGLCLELGKMKKAGMIDFDKNHFIINV